LEASILLELAQRQAELTRALQEAAIAEQNLAEATSRLQAAQQQAQAGMATALDVLQARAREAQARHDRLRALAQVARARTALLVAAGVSPSQLVQHLVGGQPPPAAGAP
ncbi:MAG TPA: TolC family protein, partial [Limnochordales bacterium]